MTLVTSQVWVIKLLHETMRSEVKCQNNNVYTRVLFGWKCMKTSLPLFRIINSFYKHEGHQSTQAKIMQGPSIFLTRVHKYKIEK